MHPEFRCLRHTAVVHDDANPATVSERLVALLEAEDFDAIADLYEPGACFVDQDGTAVGPAIVAAHRRFVADGNRLVLRRSIAFEASDIALVQWAWTVETPEGRAFDGASAEVLRRGTDGRWRFVIDNSDGAGLIPGTG